MAFEYWNSSDGIGTIGKIMKKKTVERKITRKSLGKWRKIDLLGGG